MLLTLTLPRINELMSTAVVETIHAVSGSALTPGTKLLDLSVDLSAVAAHDCPPVSLYRIVLRDRVFLRRVAVARGDELAVGALLAQFSTDPEEPLDGEAARAVRITIAGILAPSESWHEDRR